jgi:hypothetical protein
LQSAKQSAATFAVLSEKAVHVAAPVGASPPAFNAHGVLLRTKGIKTALREKNKVSNISHFSTFINKFNMVSKGVTSFSI